jgi:alpha-methylacyl-CoA racemase
MGPLSGYRIVELAGLGPGPFCGMMLGDMGADVIRVDRPGINPIQSLDPLCRNRRSIALDLKSEHGVEILLHLLENADAIFEGYRPGVAERLGFGPEVCLERNRKLVYGRMTGWGQEGPMAKVAGHDINYIALSGALGAIGRAGERPVPPLNLLGDFGGGGMLMAFGIACGLLEAQKSGRGQVIDAAMVDGSNALMATFHGFRAMGLFDDQMGTHFLSGAAHFYDTYETSDGKFISIGSLEPQFYSLLIDKLGLDREKFSQSVFHLDPRKMNSGMWAELKDELATIFRSRSRDEWCELLEGTDVCFAPVLTGIEASQHPHNVARESFIEVDGIVQNAPAPRFSNSSPDRPSPPPSPGRDTKTVLSEAGYSEGEIEQLIESGVAAVDCAD